MILWGFSIFMGFAVGLQGAEAFTILDTTNVYRGLSGSGALATPISPISPVDDIPNNGAFEIHQIDWSVSNGSLKLSIYTDFNGSGEAGTTYGDLFLKVGANQYAVAFSNHDGFTQGHLYSVSNSQTSWNMMESKTNPQYYYGEVWKQVNGVWESPAVLISGGSEVLQSQGGTSWSRATGGGISAYQIDVGIALSLLSNPTALTLFWASGTCANDIIEGTISPLPSGGQVPIPSAVWLLGSGLLGFVGLKRKFQR
jgi:hypothetical protein